MQQIISQSEQAQQLKPHRLNVLLLERAKQFDLRHTEGKTEQVLIHKLVDRNSSSFRDELLVAMDKARQGIAVEMLPTMDSEAERFFFHAKIFPNAFKEKCPDFRFNYNIYAELESTIGRGEKNLKNAIRRGSKHAEHTIVIKSDFMGWKIGAAVAKKLKDHKNLQVVEVWVGTLRRTYKRKSPP